MNIEQLLQQLKDGTITFEQFKAELAKLVDAGTITQDEANAAQTQADAGGGGGDPQPLTMEQVQKMIAEAQEKAAQSAADKVRTEYAAKLKKEQEENERLLKEKMTDEEKSKFEREKLENDLKEREAKLNAREVELHTIDLLNDPNNPLPLDFKKFLIGPSIEIATENVQAFRDAWQTAIQKAVDEKFKENGADPTKRQSGGSEKKFSEMTLTEKTLLFREDPEKYHRLEAAGK
ncbi:DUF4355 domain-containing protein [Solibacillus sp. FSL W8-0474]|uniref:capsid assembly scaffolding protein Gp46 family protein n=1 Tax=Solibacillus sp. FSL W8-0474 TaxID=2975336 RepID=UPI0030F7935B